MYSDGLGRTNCPAFVRVVTLRQSHILGELGDWPRNAIKEYRPGSNKVHTRFLLGGSNIERGGGVVDKGNQSK